MFLPRSLRSVLQNPGKLHRDSVEMLSPTLRCSERRPRCLDRQSEMTTINLASHRPWICPPRWTWRVRAPSFGVVDGRGRMISAWRKFWKRVLALGVASSSTGGFVPSTRAVPQAAHEDRERRVRRPGSFIQTRGSDYGSKVGSGWVDWCAGPKRVIPVPRSISYRKADQAEFERYHGLVMEFPAW